MTYDQETSTTKKFARTLDNISTAYHESGHTVYCLLKLMLVESTSIYIDESDRVAGITYYMNPEVGEFEDNKIKEFILGSSIGTNYAGLIAERINYKNMCGENKFPLFLKDGSAADNIEASKLIRKFKMAPTKSLREIYRINLKETIQNDLEKYWDDISLIAHSLFKHKKLKFKKLKEILLTNSVNKKFWKKQFKIIDEISKNADDLDERTIGLILRRHKII